MSFHGPGILANVADELNQPPQATGLGQPAEVLNKLLSAQTNHGVSFTARNRPA